MPHSAFPDHRTCPIPRSQTTGHARSPPRPVGRKPFCPLVALNNEHVPRWLGPRLDMSLAGVCGWACPVLHIGATGTWSLDELATGHVPWLAPGLGMSPVGP